MSATTIAGCILYSLDPPSLARFIFQLRQPLPH